MSTAVELPRLSRATGHGNLLKHSATGWFVVAVVGQWLFAGYVALFYGLSAIRGDWEQWNEVLPQGNWPSDALGNTILITHILLAIVLMVGGPLQLIPFVRQRWPRFHQWVGRTFLSAAVIASLGGLYLVWIRGGTVGDLSQHLGLSMNGVLILIAAAAALIHVRGGRIARHREWAMRLFLVVNGVWFFRIGLMFWLTINQGPVGIDFETFTGPALTFISFAQTLLPLAVLEMYFIASRNRRSAVRVPAAILLILLTIATAIGIFAATMGMWVPSVSG